MDNSMCDFTLTTYERLLHTLLRAGYALIPFEQYCAGGELPERFVILRHDIDRHPERCLPMARMEHDLGIRATYYFRAVPRYLRPEIVRAVADLGHEVGYHYEDLVLARGDYAVAYAHFEDRLRYLRTFYPVRTIAMHGSPLARWDSSALWQQYDYRALGIAGETYRDTDFGQVVYLTDTGRRWDGYRVSVRDKIPERQAQWAREGYAYHTTADLLRAIRQDTFPARLMITSHPQRWTNRPGAWLQEYIGQHIKNIVKRIWIYEKTNLS